MQNTQLTCGMNDDLFGDMLCRSWYNHFFVGQDIGFLIVYTVEA